MFYSTARTNTSKKKRQIQIYCIYFEIFEDAFCFNLVINIKHGPVTLILLTLLDNGCDVEKL